MLSDFNEWIAEGIAGGSFTALIIVLTIGEETVEPVASTMMRSNGAVAVLEEALEGRDGVGLTRRGRALHIRIKREAWSVTVSDCIGDKDAEAGRVRLTSKANLTFESRLQLSSFSNVEFIKLH